MGYDIDQFVFRSTTLSNVNCCYGHYKDSKSLLLKQRWLFCSQTFVAPSWIRRSYPFKFHILMLISCRTAVKDPFQPPPFYRLHKKKKPFFVSVFFLAIPLLRLLEQNELFWLLQFLFPSLFIHWSMADFFKINLGYVWEWMKAWIVWRAT